MFCLKILDEIFILIGAAIGISRVDMTRLVWVALTYLGWLGLDYIAWFGLA